jgi:hypothetical protein
MPALASTRWVTTQSLLALPAAFTAAMAASSIGAPKVAAVSRMAAR